MLKRRRLLVLLLRFFDVSFRGFFFWVSFCRRLALVKPKKAKKKKKLQNIFSLDFLFYPAFSQRSRRRADTTESLRRRWAIFAEGIFPFGYWKALHG